ncbi:MAG: hypothetical protein GXO92_03375 [FCB group bacterium]|nr:hypothetical protein [FCB group bacterium]
MIKPALVGLIILINTGVSDNRFYIWTYEYKTMERGEVELENYVTFSSPDMDSLAGNTSSKFEYEIEVGMTDRFDFAIYQVFEQSPSDPLRYKEYKLRGRYRFGEKGKYFVDPLLYLEYKGRPDFSKHVWEGKLILAKDIGNWNMALNPIFEVEIDESGREKEYAYTAGTSYRITDLFRLGMEVKGSENGHYIGPVIAHGTKSTWVTFGAGFALSSIKAGKPEFMLRMLLGVSI